MEIDTPFGGIYYESQLEAMGYAVSTGIRPFVSAFSSMVYAFHMPAFIALSGALFIKGYDNGKWSSFSRLLKAKFSRILLPCIVVWFAYNVPLKFISGYYDDSSLSRAFLQFFFPNNVYLWYLESLFLCFILAWLILRFSGKNTKSLVIVITLWTVGYLLQHRNAAYVPLGNPFKNLFWFWMGVYIDSVAAWIDDRIKNNRAFVCVILTALWFVLYFALVMIVKAHLTLWKETILPFAAIIVIWLDTVAIERKVKSNELIGRISSYTYGVYLYAEPWNYVVLWAMAQVAGVAVLGTVEGTVIEFLLRSVGTTVIGVIITWFLKWIKFPVKAY